MSDEISSLVFAIDSTSATKATDELDKMADAGTRAEKSADSLKRASTEQNQALNAARDAFQKLNAQIDPLNAKLEKLDDQERELSSIFRKGAIDAETYAASIARLNAQRKGLADFGISAGQTAQAMRMLPMQLTDVFTQLAGGQNPLLILVQQGGQVKDSFGGIGEAFKALGTIFTPTRLLIGGVAGALAGLAVAAYQVSGESEGVNRQLILTGNYARVTAGEVAGMAERVADASGTVSGASAALEKIIGTGAIAGRAIERIGLAAVSMNDATGKAIDDTVSEFERLAKEPAKASAALNEQYHYLTLSVYDQIRALEEQGKVQEAGEVAQEAYAAASIRRSEEIKAGLSGVEQAWRGIKEVIGDVTNAVKAPFRSATIDDLWKQLDLAGQVGNGRADSIRAEIQRRTDEQQLAASGGEAKVASGDAIKASNELNRMLRSGKSDLAKAQEIAELNQKFQALFADQRINKTDSPLIRGVTQDRNGNFAGGEYGTLLAGIEKRYTDRSGAGATNAAMKAGVTADLSSYKAALTEVEKAYANTSKTLDSQRRAQLISEDDYYAQRTALIDQHTQDQLTAFDVEEAGIRDILATRKLSAADQIRLNAQLMDLQRKRDQATMDGEAAQAQATNNHVAALNKLKQVQEEVSLRLENYSKTRAQAAARELDGYGRGGNQRDLNASLNSVGDEARQQRDAANKRFGASGGLDSAKHKETLDEINAWEQGELEKERQRHDARLQMQSDWSRGASEALNNYADAAGNTAGQVESAFGNAFKSLEDGLLNFVMTGKGSIKDFANSVIADLLRIQLRAQLSGLFKMGLSALGMGVGAAAGSVDTANAVGASGGDSIGSLISQNAGNWGVNANARGNAFGAGQILAFAAGGAFTNGVVDQPTLFPMAGGNTGLMGEAGPEAIMPLKRGPDGSLGVKASPASGGAGTTISITQHITIDARSDQASIMQGMVAAKNAAVAEIQDRMNRGRM